MADLNSLLKRSLKINASGSYLDKTASCPSEEDLGSYLQGCLEPGRRNELDSHICRCMYCQDMLIVAAKVMSGSKKSVWQFIYARKWLLGCILSFLCSFFFSRFFLQFLVISLILGMKWATEGAKSIVTVYKEAIQSDIKKTKV